MAKNEALMAYLNTVKTINASLYFLVNLFRLVAPGLPGGN